MTIQNLVRLMYITLTAILIAIGLSSGSKISFSLSTNPKQFLLTVGLSMFFWLLLILTDKITDAIRGKKDSETGES